MATDMSTATDVRLSAPAQRVLVAALEAAGWELLAVEIDMPRATARVEVKRSDGLHVMLDARNGRAMVERSMVTWRDGAKRYSGRWESVFLGRRRFEGPRSALRHLCRYLADNAPRPEALTDGQHTLRALVGALM